MAGGFNTPLAGAGGALILPSLHSPQYIPGVAGWTINRDGSAEFNNALFRGQVFVGPTNSQIQIGTQVPAVLTAYYAALLIPVTVNVAWIGQYVSATQYHYTISGLDSFARPTIGYGIVSGATVYEIRTEKFENFGGTIEPVTRHGEFTPADFVYFNSVVQFVTTDFTIGGTYPTRADVQIDGISLWRGPFNSRQYSGNPIVTATGGGAEVSLGNLGTTQYRDNRAYQIDAWFTVQATAVAGNLTMRVRRGLGIAGAIIVVRVYPALTTARTEVQFSGILITGVGAPNQDLTITAQAAAGSNFTLFATGGAQGQATIRDVGPASSYPSFPSL